MPLQTRCPKCSKVLSVPEKHLGKTIRCPGCQTAFPMTIPSDFDADIGPRAQHRSPRRTTDDDFEPWDLKVTAQKDPDKQLKGFLDGRITAEGLSLRQKDKFHVDLGVPSTVRYSNGNKLTVEIEGRNVEIAITSFNLYQARVARELAQFLAGEGPPPTRKGSVIPGILYFVAFLPVGIPIISLGGAIWGGLAGLLVTVCLAIIRREQWSQPLRIGMALAVSLAGYAALGIAFSMTFSPKKAGNGPGPVVDEEKPLGPANEPRHTDPPYKGEVRRIRTRAGGATEVRFHPDLQKMATLGNSGLCELWQVESGKRTGFFRAAHEGQPNRLTYSPPPSKYVVGWAGEPELTLRDPLTGEVLGKADMTPGGPPNCTCEVFPDQKRMVACTGNLIRFFSVPDCQPSNQFDHIKPTGHNTFLSLCITPDGKTLLTGSQEIAVGRFDEIWDLTRPSPPRRFTSFNKVRSHDRMTLSPKGDVAMIFHDGEVELVDWKRDQLLMKVKRPGSGDFTGAAITPQGTMLVTGHRDSHVRFWEIPSGKELGKIKIASQDWEPITGIAISPDNRFLTTARQEMVTLWDTKEVFPK